MISLEGSQISTTLAVLGALVMTHHQPGEVWLHVVLRMDHRVQDTRICLEAWFPPLMAYLL